MVYEGLGARRDWGKRLHTHPFWTSPYLEYNSGSGSGGANGESLHLQHTNSPWWGKFEVGPDV